MIAILFGATIFLSAFLLFQVQPIMGRFVLPWFGGLPAVWTTCMLFFQLALLAGYSYAHFSVRCLRPRVQVALHLALLLAMLAWMPTAPSEKWKPSDEENPTWLILGLLGGSIGLPFFLLSATTPLLQGWFSRKYPERETYRLYALSNAGSLLALVSYPFVVEPALPLSSQAEIWSWAGWLFALLCGLCAASVYRAGCTPDGVARLEPDAGGTNLAKGSGGNALMWFLLSACGGVMLLATTNQMCLDVAVVPFLWILPLALYLLSFVICFARRLWYSRSFYSILLIVAVIQACVVLQKGVYLGLPLQIASYAFTLFACCMVCHGELNRLRPPPENLTAYYLVISAGGAVSGILVGIAAPALFGGYWEFQIGLAATCLLLMVIVFRDELSRLYSGRPVWAWTLMVCAFAGLLITLGLQVQKHHEYSIATARNFYGVLRVREEEKESPRVHRYTLMHGRIEHGFQFRNPERRHWPTSYYGPESGFGLAVTLHPRRLAKGSASRSLRIGVIGLGTGTIASYGEQGDYICFYEINPQVVRLSDRYFSYRRDSPARVEVVLGDARVSLERLMAAGASQRYDILALDAFSSDAIPVHLLTEECFRVYWYHLKEDGILAVHISNRFFDLGPVARASALLSKGRGVTAMLIRTEANDNQGTDASDWLVATNNRTFLDSGPIQLAMKPWPQDEPSALLWTDDYCNLFRVLKPIFD